MNLIQKDFYPCWFVLNSIRTLKSEVVLRGSSDWESKLWALKINPKIEWVLMFWGCLSVGNGWKLPSNSTASQKLAPLRIELPAAASRETARAGRRCWPRFAWGFSQTELTPERFRESRKLRLRNKTIIFKFKKNNFTSYYKIWFKV